MAYYEGLVRAYREAGGGRLVDELDRIVRGIRREMGYDRVAGSGSRTRRTGDSSGLRTTDQRTGAMAAAP